MKLGSQALQSAIVEAVYIALWDANKKQPKCWRLLLDTIMAWKKYEDKISHDKLTYQIIKKNKPYTWNTSVFLQGPWAFFTPQRISSVLPSLASARRLPSWMMDKRKTGSCEPSAAAEEFLMTVGMDWTKQRCVRIETKPACFFWAGGSVKNCQTMWGAADSTFLKIGHWWEWRGFSWFNWIWERPETQEPAKNNRKSWFHVYLGIIHYQLMDFV